MVVDCIGGANIFFDKEVGRIYHKKSRENLTDRAQILGGCS